MIKVHINKNKIIITGHAGYDDYGRDIVCASASAIVVTSINACLKVEKDSLTYKEEKDKLSINITSDNKDVLLIIENMIKMLKELAVTYKKNIKIIEEERP